MNEELKLKLAQYLDRLDAGIQQTGDFVIDEVPLVVREYLNWQIYSYGFFAIIALVATILFSILLVKLCKYASTIEETNANSGPCVAGIILFGFIVILSSITCICNTYYTIKPIVAPHVVIIEKISELTSTSELRN